MKEMMQCKQQEVGEYQLAALDWKNEPHDIPAIPEFMESVVGHHLPSIFLEVDLPENHLGERSFLLKYYYYYYYYYYHTQLGAGDRFAIRILLGQE